MSWKIASVRPNHLQNSRSSSSSSSSRVCLTPARLGANQLPNSLTVSRPPRSCCRAIDCTSDYCYCWRAGGGLTWFASRLLIFFRTSHLLWMSVRSPEQKMVQHSRQNQVRTTRQKTLLLLLYCSDCQSLQRSNTWCVYRSILHPTGRVVVDWWYSLYLTIVTGARSKDKRQSTNKSFSPLVKIPSPSPIMSGTHVQTCISTLAPTNYRKDELSWYKVAQCT